MALDKDFKLFEGKPVKANAQHDRIQQAKARESIGEAIRKWFHLPAGLDFERINIEIEIRDGKFYLTPQEVKLRQRGMRPIARPDNPLSFNTHFQSQLWRKQIKRVQTLNSAGFKWALSEIKRITREHHSATPNVKEEDLLRASGPLHILGVEIGPYVGRGFDCKGRFQFLDFQPYEVPIEVKKRSAGFKYQEKKYGKEELSRAVILCMKHNLVTTPRHIDVMELALFAKIESLEL